MIQIHNIKFLRQFKGMTLRGIAKETGHDFRTVKKYVEKEDFNDHPKKGKGNRDWIHTRQR
jgi:predicted transcriptional regulator